ncbi:MAG: NAD-glutamate dehydrogenase, partial [Friedmanniella sp.]|nr:NAD-glutamate dehydrogenase [Friedmanniella sp.]
LPADVEALSPTELISACQRDPEDLQWNGGIGTYVKAASETSSEVGDKANDQLRVNGGELRASCVGEGGNLGLTQLGRIEYAQQGGRINTDFIDNSAGVDTSDHEVNIKILLAGEVRSGRLSLTDRDELLTMTTDEVGLMVLENNADQNLALANSVWQAGSMAGVHEDWMERLEEEQILDRGIEYLPTAEQMAERRTHGQGLSSPELCVLLAYTKIALEREVLATDLPDDPALAPTLVSYFPTALQQRFTDAMQKHQLRREIITTQAVNAFVNTSGMTCFHRLSGETGAPAAEVIRAQVASRRIFDAARLEESIRDLDHVMDAEVQTRLRLEVRTLVERATRWTVLNRRRPIDITTAVDQLAEGVQQVIAVLPDLLGSREHRQYAARLAGYREAGADEATARAVAVLPPAYSALSVVQTARREEVDVIRVARVHFALSDRLGLDRLLGRVVELPRDDRWQTMARAALRDDLHNVHAQLTAVVLSAGHGSEPAADLVEQWVQVTPELTTTVTRLASICDGRPDLARMSVGLRMVRGLLPAAG